MLYNVISFFDLVGQPASMAVIKLVWQLMKRPQEME